MPDDDRSPDPDVLVARLREAAERLKAAQDPDRSSEPPDLVEPSAVEAPAEGAVDSGDVLHHVRRARASVERALAALAPLPPEKDPRVADSGARW